MNRLIPRHIQQQLLVLVMIAMLPQFIAITLQNFRELRLDLAAAHDKAMVMAETVAAQQKEIEYSSRQLLSMLVLVPEVKRMDAAECDRLFAQVALLNPQFHTVAGVAADGTTFASAIQGARNYLGDRKYFKDAMANGTFSHGESVVSRSVNRPTFHYAIPFDDRSGIKSGVLYVAIDLRNAVSMINMATLPHKSEVTLYDHAGRQIFAVPEVDGGKVAPLPPDQFETMRRGDEKGSFSYRRTDGVSNIVAYRRVAFDRTKPPHLFVRVIVPEREITVPVYEKLGQQMLRLCSTTVIALLLAWFIGEYLVARKIRRVIEVAEKLGSGNLKERSGMDDAGGEVGLLAGAIDRLGAVLENDHERQEATEEELRTINTDLEVRVAEQTRELREASRFNRQIIDSVGEGIIVCDTGLRYAVWNRFMEELSGVPESKVIGKTPAEMFPFLVESGAVERFHRALSGEVLPPVDFPYHIAGTGKSGWTSETCGPLRNSSGEIIGIISTVQEITQRKQVEGQLIQARKLESIGQLAGGVAHDFNNKLSVIMGYAQIAGDELPEGGDSIREYLAEITRAAVLSRDITSQLLAFSRQQVISPQVIDPNRAIFEMQKSLVRLIGEDVRVTFNPGSGVRSIFMDPVQLDQVLMNLAVNARDAMPNGGSLTIETANYSNSGETACTDCPSGDYVIITVTDTGTGMDEETQAHLFEPFFTTKEVGKGTGLGLATIHGIISQNNGCIRVESAPGRGAVFTICLPCHGDEPHSGDAAAVASRSGGVSIMLVEDDDAVREVTAKLLRRSGYDVTDCSSPLGAIDIIQRGETLFDLILTDVIMPGMNGREMVERIREVIPGVRVIYVSGYSRDVVSRKGMITENVTLLQKPLDMAELKIKIAELLQN